MPAMRSIILIILPVSTGCEAPSRRAGSGIPQEGTPSNALGSLSGFRKISIRDRGAHGFAKALNLQVWGAETGEESQCSHSC